MNAVGNLVIRARRGDTEAFRRLVESFEQSVYALALSKVGRPDEAQDVAQDVFLEAFRTLARLETPEAFPQWIRKITLSISFQRLRKRHRHPEMLAGAGTESFLEEFGEESPIPDVDPLELPELVLRAISRVPEAYQTPLMLRYLENLTPQQIGEELGVKPGTIRVALHRGSIVLRKCLEEVLREREEAY